LLAKITLSVLPSHSQDRRYDMKAWSWLAGRQVLFGLIAVLLLGASAGAARADLFCAETRANVGEVRSGAPLAHRFILVNQGAEAVEVLDAHADCGCMTPCLDRRVFGPGEQGSLVLEVNTLTQPAGIHDWDVNVSYRTGGQEHELNLEIRGRVITELIVEPVALTLYTDNVADHEVAVTDLRSQPLSVVEARTTSPHLKASIKEQQRDDSGHKVVRIGLETKADYPDGRHDETLSLFTDDPVYRELKVPVTVVKRARQRLEATPDAVSLVAPAGVPVPSRIVLIRDSKDEGVIVERVVADDPAIVCQWAQGPNNLATLKVRVERGRVSSAGLLTAVHVPLSKPPGAVLTIRTTCRVP